MGIRGLHEIVEHGIAESQPLVGGLSRVAADALIVLIDPSWRDRCGRFAVFGPDFESVACPLAAIADRRATGAGGQAPHEQQKCQAPRLVFRILVHDNSPSLENAALKR